MIPNNIRRTLHQRHTFTNSILTPLSNDTNWQDVEVITLKQSAIDKATDQVLDDVVTMSNIDAQLANELSTAEYRINREYVDITEDKITIAVMADKVTDRVVDKAMDMLMAIVEYTPGVHYSGPEHIIDFCCVDGGFVV